MTEGAHDLPKEPPRDATTAAAEWHGRLKDGARQSTAEQFEEWLAADPANAPAYAEVEQTADWIRSFKDAPELLALRHETLSRQVMRSGRWEFRSAVAACLAAVIAVGSAGWLAFGAWDRQPADTALDAPTRSYATRMGERTDLQLPDGSMVRLNARSAVQITYSAGQRSLKLIRGQALFKVAKDLTRPFVVVAGDERITALGTEFDVRMARTSGLRVALVEGKLAVEGKGQATTILKPNDVLQSVGSHVSVSHVADLRSLVSWTNGVLMFTNTPLAEAVEELNRYSATPIMLDDPSLGSIKISGTFRAGQSRQFLEAVELAFPVRISRDTDTQIVLSRAL